MSRFNSGFKYNGSDSGYQTVDLKEVINDTLEVFKNVPSMASIIDDRKINFCENFTLEPTGDGTFYFAFEFAGDKVYLKDLGFDTEYIKWKGDAGYENPLEVVLEKLNNNGELDKDATFGTQKETEKIELSSEDGYSDQFYYPIPPTSHSLRGNPYPSKFITDLDTGISTEVSTHSGEDGEDFVPFAYRYPWKLSYETILITNNNPHLTTNKNEASKFIKIRKSQIDNLLNNTGFDFDVDNPVNDADSFFLFYEHEISSYDMRVSGYMNKFESTARYSPSKEESWFGKGSESNYNLFLYDWHNRRWDGQAGDYYNKIQSKHYGFLAFGTNQLYLYHWTNIFTNNPNALNNKTFLFSNTYVGQLPNYYIYERININKVDISVTVVDEKFVFTSDEVINYTYPGVYNFDISDKSNDEYNLRFTLEPNQGQSINQIKPYNCSEIKSYDGTKRIVKLQLNSPHDVYIYCSKNGYSVSEQVIKSTRGIGTGEYIDYSSDDSDIYKLNANIYDIREGKYSNQVKNLKNKVFSKPIICQEDLINFLAEDNTTKSIRRITNNKEIIRFSNYDRKHLFKVPINHSILEILPADSNYAYDTYKYSSTDLEFDEKRPYMHDYIQYFLNNFNNDLYTDIIVNREKIIVEKESPYISNISPNWGELDEINSDSDMNSKIKIFTNNLPEDTEIDIIFESKLVDFNHTIHSSQVYTWDKQNDPALPPNPVTDNINIENISDLCKFEWNLSPNMLISDADPSYTKQNYGSKKYIKPRAISAQMGDGYKKITITFNMQVMLYSPDAKITEGEGLFKFSIEDNTTDFKDENWATEISAIPSANHIHSNELQMTIPWKDTDNIPSGKTLKINYVVYDLNVGVKDNNGNYKNIKNGVIYKKLNNEIKNYYYDDTYVVKDDNGNYKQADYWAAPEDFYHDEEFGRDTFGKSGHYNNGLKVKENSADLPIYLSIYQRTYNEFRYQKTDDQYQALLPEPFHIPLTVQQMRDFGVNKITARVRINDFKLESDNNNAVNFKVMKRDDYNSTKYYKLVDEVEETVLKFCGTMVSYKTEGWKLNEIYYEDLNPPKNDDNTTHNYIGTYLINHKDGAKQEDIYSEPNGDNINLYVLRNNDQFYVTKNDDTTSKEMKITHVYNDFKFNTNLNEYAIRPVEILPSIETSIISVDIENNLNLVVKLDTNQTIEGIEFKIILKRDDDYQQVYREGTGGDAYKRDGTDPILAKVDYFPKTKGLARTKTITMKDEGNGKFTYNLKDFPSPSAWVIDTISLLPGEIQDGLKPLVIDNIDKFIYDIGEVFVNDDDLAVRKETLSEYNQKVLIINYPKEIKYVFDISYQREISRYDDPYFKNEYITEIFYTDYYFKTRIDKFFSLNGTTIKKENAISLDDHEYFSISKGFEFLQKSFFIESNDTKEQFPEYDFKDVKTNWQGKETVTYNVPSNIIPFELFFYNVRNNTSNYSSNFKYHSYYDTGSIYSGEEIAIIYKIDFEIDKILSGTPYFLYVNPIYSNTDNDTWYLRKGWLNNTIFWAPRSIPFKFEQKINLVFLNKQEDSVYKYKTFDYFRNEYTLHEAPYYMNVESLIVDDDNSKKYTLTFRFPHEIFYGTYEQSYISPRINLVSLLSGFSQVTFNSKNINSSLSKDSEISLTSNELIYGDYEIESVEKFYIYVKSNDNKLYIKGSTNIEATTTTTTTNKNDAIEFIQTIRNDGVRIISSNDKYISISGDGIISLTDNINNAKEFNYLFIHDELINVGQIEINSITYSNFYIDGITQTTPTSIRNEIIKDDFYVHSVENQQDMHSKYSDNDPYDLYKTFLFSDKLYSVHIYNNGTSRTYTSSNNLQETVNNNFNLKEYYDLEIDHHDVNTTSSNLLDSLDISFNIGKPIDFKYLINDNKIKLMANNRNISKNIAKILHTIIVNNNINNFPGKTQKFKLKIDNNIDDNNFKLNNYYDISLDNNFTNKYLIRNMTFNTALTLTNNNNNGIIFVEDNTNKILTREELKKNPIRKISIQPKKVKIINHSINDNILEITTDDDIISNTVIMYFTDISNNASQNYLTKISNKKFQLDLSSFETGNYLIYFGLQNSSSYELEKSIKMINVSGIFKFVEFPSEDMIHILPDYFIRLKNDMDTNHKLELSFEKLNKSRDNDNGSDFKLLLELKKFKNNVSRLYEYVAKNKPKQNPTGFFKFNLNFYFNDTIYNKGAGTPTKVIFTKYIQFKNRQIGNRQIGNSDVLYYQTYDNYPDEQKTYVYITNLTVSNKDNDIDISLSGESYKNYDGDTKNISENDEDNSMYYPIYFTDNNKLDNGPERYFLLSNRTNDTTSFKTYFSYSKRTYNLSIGNNHDLVNKRNYYFEFLNKPQMEITSDSKIITFAKTTNFIRYVKEYGNTDDAKFSNTQIELIFRDDIDIDSLDKDNDLSVTISNGTCKEVNIQKIENVDSKCILDLEFTGEPTKFQYLTITYNERSINYVLYNYPTIYGVEYYRNEIGTDNLNLCLEDEIIFKPLYEFEPPGQQITYGDFKCGFDISKPTGGTIDYDVTNKYFKTTKLKEINLDDTNKDTNVEFRFEGDVKDSFGRRIPCESLDYKLIDNSTFYLKRSQPTFRYYLAEDNKSLILDKISEKLYSDIDNIDDLKSDFVNKEFNKDILIIESYNKSTVKIQNIKVPTNGEYTFNENTNKLTLEVIYDDGITDGSELVKFVKETTSKIVDIAGNVPKSEIYLHNRSKPTANISYKVGESDPVIENGQILFKENDNIQLILDYQQPMTIHKPTINLTGSKNSRYGDGLTLKSGYSDSSYLNGESKFMVNLKDKTPAEIDNVTLNRDNTFNVYFNEKVQKQNGSPLERRNFVITQDPDIKTNGFVLDNFLSSNPVSNFEYELKLTNPLNGEFGTVGKINFVYYNKIDNQENVYNQNFSYEAGDESIKLSFPYEIFKRDGSELDIEVFNDLLTMPIRDSGNFYIQVEEIIVKPYYIITPWIRSGYPEGNDTDQIKISLNGVYDKFGNRSLNDQGDDKKLFLNERTIPTYDVKINDDLQIEYTFNEPVYTDYSASNDLKISDFSIKVKHLENSFTDTVEYSKIENPNNTTCKLTPKITNIINKGDKIRTNINEIYDVKGNLAVPEDIDLTLRTVEFTPQIHYDNSKIRLLATNKMSSGMNVSNFEFEITGGFAEFDSLEPTGVSIIDDYKQIDLKLDLKDILPNGSEIVTVKLKNDPKDYVGNLINPNQNININLVNKVPAVFREISVSVDNIITIRFDKKVYVGTEDQESELIIDDKKGTGELTKDNFNVELFHTEYNTFDFSKKVTKMVKVVNKERYVIGIQVLYRYYDTYVLTLDISPTAKGVEQITVKPINVYDFDGNVCLETQSSNNVVNLYNKDPNQVEIIPAYTQSNQWPNNREGRRGFYFHESNRSEDLELRYVIDKDKFFIINLQFAFPYSQYTPYNFFQTENYNEIISSKPTCTIFFTNGGNSTIDYNIIKVEKYPQNIVNNQATYIQKISYYVDIQKLLQPYSKEKTQLSYLQFKFNKDSFRDNWNNPTRKREVRFNLEPKTNQLYNTRNFVSYYLITNPTTF